MPWDLTESDALLDGYAEWELAAANAHPRNTAQLVLPVFVRLNPGSDSLSFRQIVNTVLELSGDAYLPDYEIDLLRTELDCGLDNQDDLRVMAFCTRDFLSSSLAGTLWSVLAVGSPVAQVGRLSAFGGNALPVAVSGPPAKPMVGIIDDGIGFLNRRFRFDDLHTRFRAVWLMGENQAINLVVPALGNGVFTGRIFERADIDALLASGRDESDIYHQLNDQMLPPSGHKSTNRAVGHGTHLLDLAAGSDPASIPADPIAATELLAVQLPSRAIEDTSGRRSDHLIVQALRWIISRAGHAVADPSNTSAPVPLIVNLSLGSLAGPKDHTAFLANWLDYEIRRFSNQPGNPKMRITAAYGNAYRDKLVADFTLGGNKSVEFDWCILPDDRTPSFMELRASSGRGGDVEFAVLPAPGMPDHQFSAFPLFGQKWQCKVGGKVVATVSRQIDSRDMLLFTVWPTVSDYGGTCAQPGFWRLKLTNTSASAIQISARVQRDDTPAGYRNAGRQSWLNHPEASAWDGETKDYSAPATGCPIARQGTEVAYSGILGSAVTFVAAARPDPAVEDGTRPSPYSAASADAAHDPDVMALADEGAALTGIRASGIVTGSTARLSGTSVAAPKMLRQILNGMLQGRPINAPAELRAVLPTAYPASRTGAGTIVDDPT